MKKAALKFLTWSVSLLGFALVAKADSITNSFLTSSDYVANGIIGDTFWDGVDLAFGDIPNGNVGGSGAGSTMAANTSGGLGFLSVQTIGSDWSGNGDDGFLLWKKVAGDFDVSVESVPPWTDQGNNFGGLMVRAYNTNFSTGPVSFTSTNASENFMVLWRDQQFTGSEIRQSTNGVNFENTINDGGSTDTNSTRFYRITRTGDVFTFFEKTNAPDPWTLITSASAGGGYVAASGTITRPDLHGQAVQVGIAQAIFARPGGPAVDFFEDFELTGTNVTATSATLPAAPSNLAVSAPNTNGSLTFSWTTNGGTGSVLILRRLNGTDGNIVANPIQGFDYSTIATPNFKAGTNLIAGATAVVFAGSGSSVTVSNLGGSNNVYTAELVAFDSSGPSIVYNTANPVTLPFLGSGLPVAVTASVVPSTLMTGGVGQITVTAIFSTGDQVNVTTDPSVTLTADNPAVLLVNAGLVTALANGSGNIISGYAGFSGTNAVTVASPRFTDSFSTPHNYLTNGLPGSDWDGLYDRLGDVPGGNTGGDNILMTDIDADISTNNVLTVIGDGEVWQGASDGGFYLFKNMPSDFEAIVHVTFPVNHQAFDFSGLMARGAQATGAPIASGEQNAINWFFDQFSVITSTRGSINGAAQTQDFDGTVPVNSRWLLLQRQNLTNFFCYNKANPTDPWILPANGLLVVRALTNSVQIGIAQSTFSQTPQETVSFDSFSLDGTGLIAPTATPIPPAASNLTMTFNPDTSITLRWFDPIANDGTAPAVARSFVVMRQGAPVTAQPALANALAGNSVFGDPNNNLGSGNFVVYRTGSGDTNQNQSVTVTGLSPGAVYYAAVYTFSSLGANRTFNTAITTFTNEQDGDLTNIVATLGGSIPLNGAGIVQVTGLFSGGGTADVSTAATIVSGNTNILLSSNNVVTGKALGTATLKVSVSGFTNSFSATVRNPTFTDNFTVSHDYLNDGVTNTPYDGVYEQPGNIPDTTFVSATGAATLAADANITTNGLLTVSNISEGFEFNQNDGFFLFKYVPGDFQMGIDLAEYTNNGVQSYENSGILVRGYNEATNGTLGAPMSAGGLESFLDWVRFDEFGIGTRYEEMIDNGNTIGNRPANTDVAGPEHLMLMVRQGSTNFFFYQRASTNLPWHTTSIGNLTGLNAITKFANQPLQAGIVESGFDSGTAVVAGFANFMLDVSPVGLQATASGGSVTVSWPGAPSLKLQTSGSLATPNWQPVTVTPIFINGQFIVTLPSTGSAAFFRLQD